MKKNVLIVLASATCMLVSCGNARLPQISDEQGIEIAKNMLTRHSDSSLFQLPNKFVITIDSNNNDEAKTPSGHTKSWSKVHSTYNFDLDNLYYKEYQKNTEQDKDSEYTCYCFYDNATGLLYNAYNNNDYKTRSESKMTAEVAKSKIEYYRSSLLYFITCDSFLISFGDTISRTKDLHEKYKSEKDQYCNYFVGSADVKSLQFTIEEKLKITQGEDPEYTGYVNNSSSIIFQNDMVSSYSLNSSKEIKSKDNKFYNKLSGDYTSSTSCGSCPIEKPNIGEYILH